MTEAAAPGFGVRGLHASDDRKKDIWVVAIERRIASNVWLFRDLNGSGDGAIALDGTPDKLPISLDVAGSGVILQDEIEHSAVERVQLTARRGRDIRPARSRIVHERG